jgi:hypothetical protein
MESTQKKNQSGNWRFSGTAFGTSSDFHVLVNNSVTVSTNVNGYKTPFSFSFSRKFSAGDNVDFAVGYGANKNYNNDSTGISVTIVSAQ